MYCIKCGVKLADTEKKCPLCETVVYHPDLTREPARPLYPANKMPPATSIRAVICGAIIFLFMIPLLVTFLSDILPNGKIDWFDYVGGGIVIAYLNFALPMWFAKPNPVIFVPCSFLESALYLLYINLATGGDWFLTFALPVSVATAIITCIFVTLLKYLRKGKLFVIGGSAMGLGALALMTELLMDYTFHLSFMGWSLYPMILFFVIGGMLIYLAINKTAREKLERKLFF